MALCSIQKASGQTNTPLERACWSLRPTICAFQKGGIHYPRSLTTPSSPPAASARSAPNWRRGQILPLASRALSETVRFETASASLRQEGLDPDSFTKKELKKLCPTNDPANWKLRQASGVPIRSVVLLRTMSDPVIITRKKPEYATGKMIQDDGKRSKRAYVGGNNHHIEIRVNEKGKWEGRMVTAFEAAQRNLAKLRALREAGIPKPSEFRKLSKAERRKLKPLLRSIEEAHPIVDRRDNDAKGGAALS